MILHSLAAGEVHHLDNKTRKAFLLAKYKLYLFAKKLFVFIKFNNLCILGGFSMRKYRFTNIQYKVMTILLLFAFPPVGIALLCSNRTNLSLIGKILIIIIDVFYFAFICMLLFYSPIRR